jgi:cytochrome oxidase assembly protein ShyY1
MSDEEFGNTYEYKPIKLTGRFDKVRFVYVQKTKENEPGYQLVNPFLLNNGAEVIVDRGWVPLNWNKIKEELDSDDNRTTTITGIVYKGDRMNDYTKTSDTNIMVNMDTKQISKLFNIETEFIIKEIGSDRKLYPRPLRVSELMTWTITPSTHQSYSTFWLFVTTINILSNIYIWLI